MAHVAAYWKRGARVWRCEYEDAAGLRRRKLFRTREAADDCLVDVLKSGRRRLDPTVTPSIPFGAYATDVWRALHFAQVKESTRRAYATELRCHLVPALGTIPVRDLTRARIKRFFAEKLADYARRGKDGRPGIRLMLAVLHLVLESAREDQLIPANPAERLSKSLRLGVRRRGRSERVKALTRAERDGFLAAARALDPALGRLWAVHVLGGYRPGELYALTEADVHLDDGRPTVRIEKALANHDRRIETSPKGNQARSVDLSAAAVVLLRAQLGWRKQEKLSRGWREMPAPLFFGPDGDYLHAESVRRAFKRVLRAAGLPGHHSPHSLRHTFASLALHEGKDVYYVCRMLGHASIQETVDTYARWLPANRHGELDSLDPALGAF